MATVAVDVGLKSKKRSHLQMNIFSHFDFCRCGCESRISNFEWTLNPQSPGRKPSWAEEKRKNNFNSCSHAKTLKEFRPCPSVGPNCFGQVQIFSDKSKKFWTYRNGFRLVQNVLDMKDKLKSYYCSSLIWTRINCFRQDQNRSSIWSRSKNIFSLLDFIFEPLFWASLKQFGQIKNSFDRSEIILDL